MLFVLAFLFYNDGVQTVIDVSGAYAEDTLGLATEEIVIAFLIVQFVAYFGALGFGVLGRPDRDQAGDHGRAGRLVADLRRRLPAARRGDDAALRAGGAHRARARRGAGIEPQPLRVHDPRGGVRRVLRVLLGFLQVLGDLRPFGVRRRLRPGRTRDGRRSCRSSPSSSSGWPSCVGWTSAPPEPRAASGASPGPRWKSPGTELLPGPTGNSRRAALASSHRWGPQPHRGPWAADAAD